MSLNSVLLDQAKKSKVLKNQTETQSSGRSIAAIGKAPARLIGYVELGTHPQPDYQGKPKDPATELAITFEVFGTKNTKEIEVDGKKKKVGALLTINTTEKLSDKSKYKKLFDKMQRGRKEITHMTHMLNEVFMLDITHGVGKNSKLPYATIEAPDKSFRIDGPMVDKFNEEGEVIETIDVTSKVPQASFPLRMFVVDDPSIEQWQSIKMEGTYKKKVKGADGEEVEQEISKNYLQEKIMSALNWEGSAMQAILMGLGDEAAALEGTEAYSEEEPVDEEVVPEDEAPVEEAPAPKPAAKKPATAAAASPKSTTAKPAATATAAKAASPSKPKAEPVPAADADDLASIGL